MAQKQYTEKSVVGETFSIVKHLSGVDEQSRVKKAEFMEVVKM